MHPAGVFIVDLHKSNASEWLAKLINWSLVESNYPRDKPLRRPAEINDFHGRIGSYFG